MKHTISVFLSAAALLVACNEDFIGQYPVDNVAPASVSDVRVENLPGSAMISYSLPNETDLLYVKAVYTDSHGVKTEVKSSVFKDNVVLKGFGRSKKQTVQLVIKKGESQKVTYSERADITRSQYEQFVSKLSSQGIRKTGDRTIA